MRLSDSSSAKEKLSAYQRWEMTSFEDEDHPASHAKELDPSKIAAQKEGFAKGFEEGHQVGLKAGQEEGLKSLQQACATFQQITTQFANATQQAEHVLAQQVLDLALDLAKVMIKSALSINPEFIIPIIKEAIANLPSVQSPAKLFLHPSDATLVNEKMGDALTTSGWVIASDASLQPGDCRIETLTNQINGALPARWKQLTDALGRDNKWFD